MNVNIVQIEATRAEGRGKVAQDEAWGTVLSQLLQHATAPPVDAGSTH